MELNGFAGAATRPMRATLAVAVVMTAACSGNPTQPTASTPGQINTPPPALRTAPVITALSISPRVEAEDDFALTATVEDADTPLDQLRYEWSVSPSRGTFLGTGRRVTWRAPRAEHSPDVYVFTLTVVDSYMNGSQPGEQRTSASVSAHYNDSHAETAALALEFLRDYANTSVSAEQVVRNFSDSCPGKATELQHVQTNRRDYQMLGGDFSIELTGLYDDRTFGDVVAPCTFRSVSKSTGRSETTAGTCVLTTVYENWRWKLCGSQFTTGNAAALRRTSP